MNKKAMTWQQIMLAIIALVVVILVIMWFRGSGSKAFGQVGTQLDQLGDCDKDNVANMFDKCPCDAVVGEENEKAQGCPKNMPPNECTPDEIKKCKDE